MTQKPLTQGSPLGHARPQLPQCALSFVMSVQTPPQYWTHMHVPPMHAFPIGHAVPQ